MVAVVTSMNIVDCCIANKPQWIDPSSGIGGLLTTQLSPPGDPMFTKCLIDLETALYSQLRATN